MELLRACCLLVSVVPCCRVYPNSLWNWILLARTFHLRDFSAKSKWARSWSGRYWVHVQKATQHEVLEDCMFWHENRWAATRWLMRLSCMLKMDLGWNILTFSCMWKWFLHWEYCLFYCSCNVPFRPLDLIVCLFFWDSQFVWHFRLVSYIFCCSICLPKVFKVKLITSYFLLLLFSQFTSVLLYTWHWRIL